MDLSFLYSIVLLIGIGPLFRFSVDPRRHLLIRCAAWLVIHVSCFAFLAYAASRVFSRLSDQHILYTIAGFGGAAYLLLAAWHLKIVGKDGNETRA